MARSLLFCIVEEAKPSGLKSELAGDEAFETAFVGASEEDCQNLTLKRQDTAMFIEPNIIGIADARTARDDYILMQWYREGEGEHCPPYGVLPPKPNTWWDFRIHPEQADRVIAGLHFVESDVSCPRYFGRKEELTDENGVLDAAKADRMVNGD
ncbi:hypothetical protein EJ02DRAFT_470390 [Clathrospora elynae]|uniref:Uncharacterized protein n=1 Tax=Clathrospora elynae TaxID=706981 RepID=A0A6A5S9F5_9PLEO|nr:hypothetical protein EJ02DRAFT_470390 [Clathrospora elynae]